MRIISGILIIVFLFQSCVFSNRVNGFKLNETVTYVSKPIKLNKILIVGIGSTSSRIFLDDLSANLIRKLKSRKVESEYQYWGKEISSIREELKEFENRGKYDAFLVFSPNDSSMLKFASEVSVSNYTILESNFSLVKVAPYSQYHQQFVIQLFQQNDKIEDIWSGVLKVDCDLSRTTIYDPIAKKIVKGIEKMKVQN